MGALREHGTECFADGCARGLYRPVRHKFPQPAGEMEFGHATAIIPQLRPSSNSLVLAAERGLGPAGNGHSLLEVADGRTSFLICSKAVFAPPGLVPPPWAISGLPPPPDPPIAETPA